MKGSRDLSPIEGEADLPVGNEGIGSQVAFSIEKYKLHTFYKASMSILNSHSFSQSSQNQKIIRAQSVRGPHFEGNSQRELIEKRGRAESGSLRGELNESGDGSLFARQVSESGRRLPKRASSSNQREALWSTKKIEEERKINMVISEDSKENIDSPMTKRKKPEKKIFPSIGALDPKDLMLNGETVGIGDANDEDNDGPGLAEKMRQYSSLSICGYLLKNKSFPTQKGLL